MTFPSSYDLPPKIQVRDPEDFDDLDEEPQEDPVPDDNGPNHSCYRPGGY